MKRIVCIEPGQYYKDKRFPKTRWAESYLESCIFMPILELLEEVISSHGNACSELANERDWWESEISYSVLIEKLKTQYLPLITIFESYEDAKKEFPVPEL